MKRAMEPSAKRFQGLLVVSASFWIGTACGTGDFTPPAWEQTNLPEPFASVETVAPGRADTAYAGTLGGIYRSVGVGEWSRIEGFDNAVDQIFVTVDGTLLVGTYRAGLFRSVDAGTTWSNVGFTNNVYIYGLVQDLDQTLYASAMLVQESGGGDTLTGVFRSDDDGQTWRSVGLVGLNVLSLSLAPDGALFAGTQDGLFVSRDKGASWSPSNQGLPPSPPVSAVQASDGALLAAMGMRWEAAGNIPGDGVYRSEDGGATWARSAEGLKPETSVRAFTMRGDTVFLVAGDRNPSTDRGVFSSMDGGRSWTRVPSPDEELRSLTRLSDGRLLAGSSEHGVYSWLQGSLGFERYADGFSDWEVSDVQVHPSGRLFAEKYYSDDQGASWHKTGLPGSTRILITSDGTLFAGTVGEVFRSGDGGGSWESSSLPGRPEMVMRLAADSSGNLYAAAGASGLYRSRDAGGTWQRLNLPPQRWHMAYGLSTTASRDLLVSDGQQFLRTTDGGESWAVVEDSPPWAFDMKVCGQDTVFAAVYSQGLFRSVDDGWSWHEFGEGLRSEDEYLTLSSLLCREDGLMLAGALPGGVFYSVDRGESWHEWNAGLRNRMVLAVTSDPEGTVFVGTERGVHRATWPLSKKPRLER